MNFKLLRFLTFSFFLLLMLQENALKMHYLSKKFKVLLYTLQKIRLCLQDYKLTIFV